MRGIRFGVFLAGLALFAAGCGTTRVTSGGGDTPASLTAAARGTAARTARIAETTSMRMGGMTISYTAAGEFDFARARGRLGMRAPLNATMLFLPPKAYLKMPAGAGGMLPKGKTWLELDDKTLGGSAVPGLGGFAASSPADLLTSLTAISGSIRKLGTASVRGVAVTGYRVTIDPVKAAKSARLPAAERAGYRQFAASLGTGAISADVWVDGGNLVRRVRLSLRLPAALSTGPGSVAGKNTRMTETTDFYDFGVPVRVSPPPAAQVASMGQIIAARGPASAGGGFGGPSSAPPPASGTLTPDQAAAAEQAVTALFTALGRNDAAAVARTVLPSQRSCVTSSLSGGPKITVKSLRIISAAPAGTGKATVRFTVSASASLGGATIPVLAPGSGGQRWLATAEAGGHWYVDLTASTAIAFGGPC